MTLHVEVLDEGQKRILPGLGAAASEAGFYLAGGTAVALHLGHRRSADFDWFTSGPLADPLALAQTLRSRGLALEEVQTAPGTLHGLVEGVRLSFLRYDYPLVGQLLRPDEYALELAPLDDLACMKLAAAAQRGSRKDFIDIYAIGGGHGPLGEMLEAYRRKYSTSDIGHVLAGLAYFDDAEHEPMPAMIWDVTWAEVRQCISEWVRKAAG